MILWKAAMIVEYRVRCRRRRCVSMMLIDVLYPPPFMNRVVKVGKQQWRMYPM